MIGISIFRKHTCNCGACIEMPKLFLEGKPVDGLRSHHTCDCSACIANMYFDGKDVSGMRNQHICGCNACIANTNSIVDILSLINSEANSFEFFRQQRWKVGMYCPWCRYKKIYHLSDGKLKCSRCRKKFTDLSNTFLSGIRLKTSQITYLLGMFIIGVPAFRINKKNISKLTVQRMYKLFREAIYNNSLIELKRLSNKLNLDESMFVGQRNEKSLWSGEGKSVILGISKRNEKIIVFPVLNKNRSIIEPLMNKQNQKGNIYYTDKYDGYIKLDIKNKNIVITQEKRKSEEESKQNGLEEFWRYAKLWLYHYRSIRSDHIHLFIKEIEFRFNNKNHPIKEKYLFDELVNFLLKG